jgi:YesN/AraC family two-component response regulator
MDKGDYIDSVSYGSIKGDGYMYRVLVADDEPIERKVVSKKIKKFYPGQVEVVSAQNGTEAVEKFREETCHAVILDIAMPGMSGLEAAKQIRELSPSCSIIFLTAFDDFNYAKKAIEVKALDYLLKPGKDEELQSVLDEAFSLAENDRNVSGSRDTIQASKLQNEENGSVRMNAVAHEIRLFIETNYTKDISLQDIAAAMGYSDAYFCKLFKQCFDKNFITYLNDFRTQKAIELLGDVTVSIKDVSYKTGYRDANYFARIFKRNTGLTPSEYREKYYSRHK